jgi:hypothetical protein
MHKLYDIITAEKAAFGKRLPKNQSAEGQRSSTKRCGHDAPEK